jgi:hypothetical protein
MSLHRPGILAKDAQNHNAVNGVKTGEKVWKNRLKSRGRRTQGSGGDRQSRNAVTQAVILHFSFSIFHFSFVIAPQRTNGK